MRQPVLLLSALLSLTLLAACGHETAERAPEDVEIAGAPHGSDPAALRAEIEQAAQQWEDAYNAGDAAGLAALYTADARLLPPGSEPVEGRGEIRDFIQSLMGAGTTSVEMMPLQVHAAGDFAVEEGRTVITDPGGAVLAVSKHIALWRREDGQWRIHRDLWNASAPAPGNR